MNLSPSSGRVAAAQSPVVASEFPTTQINSAASAGGKSFGADVKDGNSWIDFANQMTNANIEMEKLKASITELKRISSEAAKRESRDAYRDHVKYFCQIVNTFVFQTFIMPLEFPSDLFGKLASGEDAEFCKRVQVLGAPMGVTVEILLELENFFDEDASVRARPRISKTEFIEVVKSFVADRRISESSVDACEKMFDVVYCNRL